MQFGLTDIKYMLWSMAKVCISWMYIAVVAIYIRHAEQSLFTPFYCHRFYRAMHVVLARYCYRKSSVRPSVRPSVCNVDVPRAYRLD